MTGFDADSMHRLAKLALDAGEVASPEEAVALFSGYRLRIVLGRGWADTLAGQACFVTAVNTAARAFLGGVEVCGELDAMLRIPLFEGRNAATVAPELGATITAPAQGELPTLVLGGWVPATLPRFCVSLRWDGWRAWLAPGASDITPSLAHDHPLAGVAAAALGVNEAFLHIRGDMPAAGDRTVGLSLWTPLAVAGWRNDEHSGPPLRYLPDALWLVGLGHLGQAYAWTLGMLPYGAQRPHLVLQDFDKAAASNLSTCLLLDQGDLGQRKVRVVSRRLEAAGFTTAMVERRFGPDHRVLPGEPTTALFGVDNLAARRDLASAGFGMVVEAGLGSGHRDFRNIRTHTFPGPHSPAAVWPAEAGAQPAVELNDAYRQLAQERDDLCGMTQLASRAVATPFVGVLAAALVLAEVVRPLHGGGTHAVLDLQMKDLRHRTGAPLSDGPVPAGFLTAG
ncbi:thiamine biosynthesis protein ThiF [Caenimonas sedimenti]|uniref:Thiamine biosynthesis protein ThiF n=1 Tax=Caenimonas sedimenti TaxID=2596921 RepID=A0A562ZSM2_9BURK|nr:ThiF family adenylyltransferase [Caenimonas sedimenti]TWO71523.1 thiamine biosynthesis protein ThiF [Caenimonas sedimenti]